MNPSIVKLADTLSAFDAIRQGLIRCGFEFEFENADGYTDGEEDEDNRPQEFIQVDNIEVGTDSSVSGGEARTIGALTPTEFMTAATTLFGAHEYKIGTGCSFHVHLSVPGVKHKYGRQLQAEMYAYLLTHAERLPKAVRKRLTSEALRYCMFKLDTDKFRAVHAHPQHTWEFRLFGNIATAHEARACLMLAIDALRHAYRVRLRRSASLIPERMWVNSEELSSKVFKTDTNLPLVLRADRLADKAS